MPRRLGTFLPEALRSLSERRVTTHYPSEPARKPDRFRGRIVIDQDRCNGCSICDKVCPTDAIEVERGDDEVTWRFDVTVCIFCGECVDGCPSDALTASKEFELATSNPEGLKREFTFPRASRKSKTVCE